MSEIIIGLIVIIASMMLSLKLLALWSQRRSAAAYGVIDGELAPCPGSPNCQCTEGTSNSIQFRVEPNEAWLDLITTVEGMNGHIITNRDGYMHAVFKSKVFGFVEDLEARLDSENSQIHLRSASRVGYSDMGSNLERIDTIKKWMGE